MVKCHDDIEYMFPKTTRQPISGEFVGQRRRITGPAICGDVAACICLSDRSSVQKKASSHGRRNPRAQRHDDRVFVSIPDNKAQPSMGYSSGRCRRPASTVFSLFRQMKREPRGEDKADR